MKDEKISVPYFGNNELSIPECGFTHGSKFHSDDVFSTALLRMINPDIQIIRGFEVPDAFEGIVYDIGRGRFDHHQEDKEYRENGIPYAAFGLLWREFGEELVGVDEAKRFDEKFIQALDESDNLGTDHILAKVIADFNPGWDSQESYDTGFWKAVEMAQAILTNHFKKVSGVHRAKELVRKAMQDSDGTILMLPCFAPWKDQVVGSGYQLTIYPSNRGGYSVQGVPHEEKELGLLCPFPQEWCGKTQEELQTITGIAGFRFCHPSGFLAAAESKEAALGIAEAALKYNESTFVE